MSSLTRWWARLTVLAGSVLLALWLPAAAWASERPVLLAAGTEVVRRRKLGGRLNFGFLCCLLVVVLVVVLVMLVNRGRGRRS